MTIIIKIPLVPTIRDLHCKRAVQSARRMDGKTISDLIQRSPGFLLLRKIAYKASAYPLSIGLTLCAVCLLCTAFFSVGNLAYSEGYKPVSGVIHLDSTISGGALSPEAVAGFAHDAGVEIAIFTDHDTMRWEYGLLPLRGLVRKVVEKNSVYRYGEANYLKTIRGLNQKYPGMLAMPGVEAIPFYWWKGSYFTKDLTLMDGHKHLLVMGLKGAEDYKNLPSIGKGYPRKITSEICIRLWPICFFVFAWFLFTLARAKPNGKPLKFAGVMCIFPGIIVLLNNFPFTAACYDQYHGSRGIAPYQEVINYVNSRGGVTFWAHPELVEEGNREISGIKCITEPYHEDLLKSRDYTGFAAFAAGTKFIIPPGGIWDQILNQYRKRERNRPVWAIGEVDFGDDDSFSIKDSQTIFLLKDKSEEAVIDALKAGRVYALHLYKENVPTLVLDNFTIENIAGKTVAYMGDELRTGENPHLSIHVSCPETEKNAGYKIDIIRNGEVIHQFKSSGNTEMIYDDNYFKSGECVYYRLDIDGPSRIISNPIFVKFDAALRDSNRQ
jgi:hypothetical protein